MNKQTADSGVTTHKTFCRFCHVFCGMEVDVKDGRAIAVRGDRDHPMSGGYTCTKGRSEIDRLYHPDRLLGANKRIDGKLRPIDTQQALDEVSQKLRQIIDRHGPDAVAAYTGCGGHRTANGGPWMVGRWLRAMGSRSNYTSFTIDSPSTSVAAARLYGGPMPFGVPDLEHSEVAMFVGTNPVVSHQFTMQQSNPSRRLKDAQKRGMKLVVIDPRRSDVAHRADVHLQVKPGEDATLLATMLKVIIDNDWHDREYVDKYCSGFAELKKALKPFTPEYAERRCAVPAETIIEGARVFATAATGAAQSGTGLHMAAHQLLTTQLVMTFNAICGRLDRRGGLARIHGPLTRKLPKQLKPLKRQAFTGETSRVRHIPGITGMFGDAEMPTNTLSDEILTEGEGQIRALIVNGGNPALVFPDAKKTINALKRLDLLVCLDLFESATARHAHYVFGVKHPFERSDIPRLMNMFFPAPFMQYTDALVEPPPGAIEEWEFFWETARQLDLDLGLEVELDENQRPAPKALMQALNRNSRISIEEISKYPSGKIFGDTEPMVGGLIPDMVAHPDHRIAVGHPEVIKELKEVMAEPVTEGTGHPGGYEADEDYEFRCFTYRLPEVYCTTGRNLPWAQRKRPYNPALLNSEDMAARGLTDGDRVRLSSSQGQLEVIIEGSDRIKPGTIGLAHGWGDLEDEASLEEKGSNVQLLIPNDRRYNPVTGQSLQSAFPVNLSRA
jgi:anaerobic selenocysteine-containing dehydrogenase